MAQRGLPGATGAGADGGAAGDHGEGAVARRQNLETWKHLEPGTGEMGGRNGGKHMMGKCWEHLEWLEIQH